MNKNKIMKYLLIFILITLVVVFICLTLNNSKQELNIDNNINNNSINIVNNNTNTIWKVKYIKKEEAQPLISENKQWEEKEIYEKFYKLTFYDNDYYSNKNKIEDSNIADFIETTKIIEYDDEKLEHESTINIYNIKNISNKCAIAVKFEHDNNFYIYTNLYYVPTTLENLIEDLNLIQEISFNSIIYHNKNENNQYENIEFENIKKDDVINFVFDNISLNNLYNEGSLHMDYIITIKANISILNSDIDINITTDGYLITNILGTEKIFYLGDNKVEEFVDYIIRNYTGYKIVYTKDEKDEMLEENDTIIKINNTLSY